MSGIKFEEPSEKDIFIPKFKYKIHFNLLHFSKVMKRKNNNQLYGGKFLWGRSIDRITFFRNSFLSFEFHSFEKSEFLFFLLNYVLSKLGQGRSG